MNVTHAIGGRAVKAAGPPVRRTGLSMYNDPPNEMLTLEDFEVLAFERLKVLKAIENAKSRGVKPRELNDVIKDAVKTTLGLGNDPETIRRDNISHHILRLAYCSSDDNRRWLLTQECALFRWRAERETPDQISDFMARASLSFTPVSEEEKASVLPQLRQVWEASVVTASASSGGGDGAAGGTGSGGADDASLWGTPETSPFFKIPFLQALDLIRGRSVFLQGGYAYVPRHKMVSILVGKFRTYLSFNLIAANRFLPEVLRDERLKPMLENMAKAYTGPDYGAARKSVDRVTADDVDPLAQSAFPLCMQVMHQSLRDKHKLKHLGRLQYGLFLKGVGLSMEDALVYWQREFTKGMSGEEFVKRYAYNIRYNYGKEGKRSDFSPYSCVKIITASAPAGDEVHGCPYKNWDIMNLRAILSKMKLAPAAIDGVMESVKTKEYQVACRRQWEARFPGGDSGQVGNHPNGYTEAAVRAIKAMAAAEGGAAAAVGAASGSGAAGAAAPSAGAFAATSSPRAAPSGAPAMVIESDAPPSAVGGAGAAAAVA